MHFLLIYDTVPDYANRRTEYRAEHLAYAWRAVERGELILGGAVGEPADGAVLLFQADSAAVPTAFATGDPYVQNGLVARWTVKPWATVVGNESAQPIR